MNNDKRQVTTYSSGKYIFWFHVMRKSAFAFPWNMPKQLVKIVVADGNIRSEGPIWLNRSDVLNVPLRGVVEVKLVISTGHIGTLEIVTQDTMHYSLVPTNPLDPTLLSHSNIDEVMAFKHVVAALKENRVPEFDENPYIRQFSRKDKPDYLNSEMNLLWDQDISPWEYYYQSVPASVDKKKRAVAKIYEIIVLSVLSVMALAALYAIYVRFSW